MNFYKHYMGDYQRDTMRLSMVEDGAYRRLLDEYYATEEPLPSDHEECYRAARALTNEERKAVDKILDKYFEKQVDGYHHTRIDEEIAKAQAYADAQSKRAQMRWHNQADNDGNTPEEPTGSPNHNHSQTTNNHNHSKKYVKEDYDVAEKILSLILEISPKFKKPNLEKWAESIRLIRERDNRTHQEIIELFTWANNDNFWKTNILSPDTLRKQWDKLALQKQQKVRGGSSSKQSKTERLKNAFASRT